jgi:AbrB family looped-hinge helix DNA binding protein
MAHRKRRRSEVPVVREATASFTVQVGARGRLVLPAATRDRLGVKTGDRMVLTVEADGSVRLRTFADVARATKGIFADIQPHRRLSDELIRERRREARREEAE